jgi:hypothetical protein
MYEYEEVQMRGDATWMMWWARIRACQRYRRDHPFGESNWQRYYQTYKNFHWEDGNFEPSYELNADNLAEKITVNITLSNILKMVPFLVNTQAEFQCEPRKPEDVVMAMLKQNILNYEFEHRKIQKQLKKVVYDGCIIGHGIMKTGFVREIDTAEHDKYGDLVFDDMIEDESIYGKRVSPFNFWFDYAATEKDLATARFTIERYYKYVPDLIENTSYKKSVRMKIKSGFYSVKTTRGIPEWESSGGEMRWITDAVFDTYESDLACLYEVFDRQHNRVLTFCEGILEPIREISNPYPYLRGEFPYIQYDFIYTPDEPWGMGIPEMIEDQQYELDRHRTFGFQHRRKCSSTIYEVLDSVDEDEAEKLPDAEDGTFVFVPQIGSISPVKEAPLPRDYPLQEGIIKADIDELVGFDPIMRGERLQGRATLGEVQSRTGVSSLKLNERVDTVDDLFLMTGKQCVAHIGANYHKERVVKLFGKQGMFWVTVSNDDIKGEIDLKLLTVSAPKKSPEMETQQRGQVFQFSMQLLPFIQAGFIPPDAINFVELLKWWLESFHRQDIGRFFKGALMPIQPLAMLPEDVPGQFAPQQQEQLGEGGGNPQDFLRMLSQGNMSGLQIA